MKLLDYKKTEALLKKYGIPLIETKIVKSEKEAEDFADKFGYPVVLKVFSPEILHRTEKKLVELCAGGRELKRAFQKLSKKIVKKSGDFLLIQKKGEGTELICGMKRDSVFGPVLLFGLGGIFVEALKDVGFGIAPFSKEEAKETIKSIRGFKILQGCRGRPSANLEKIAEVLVRISKLAENNPEIKEIDFNPVFAKGGDIEAADFKLFI